MTIRLRPFQIEAMDAVEADLDSGIRRPAVVAATGSGKTIMFSDLIRRRGVRSLVIAHTTELIDQAARRFADVNPGTFVGIVKAERDETNAPVVVSSIQTLIRPERRARLSGIGLVIVDEAHLYAADRWREALDGIDAPVVGFTATMARGDGRALKEVWDKISYEYPLIRGIREGYLVDVKGVTVKVPDLDLAGLHSTGGDYRDGELGHRLAASLAPSVVAKAYREHACRADGSPRPGILFAPTVATAKIFSEALCAEGFAAAPVWGAMPTADRKAVLAAYDAGDLDILTSVSVLAIGFDSPRAEVAVIARPTRSGPLYIQQCGRVLRPYPGKASALILDVVGASAAHELATLATLAGDDVPEVKEGTSLLKALDELEREPSQEEEGYTGAIVVESVDLFAGSRQQWLQTEAGHWFIPAGERIIALVPSKTPGAHDVAWFATKTARGGYLARGVSDLGIAMAHGEGSITWEEEVMSSRDRAWRRSKASDKQWSYARGLGIKVDDLPRSTRGGAMGDLISVKLATRRIDARVARSRG